MAAAEWPLADWGLALDFARTISLRLRGATLDHPSATVASDGDREVKDRHVGRDCHRTQPIGIDGVDRASTDHLWSWVIVRLLAATVVVIKQAARDVPLPIGYETSGHQHRDPAVVPIKREGIVALQATGGGKVVEEIYH